MPSWEKFGSVLRRFNIKCAKTSETVECSGAGEKEDREKLRVIRVAESQWISSEAKIEPGLISYGKVCYEQGAFLLKSTFTYLNLPIAADNRRRAEFARNGRQNGWTSFPSTAGRLTTPIPCNPQQWIHAHLLRRIRVPLIVLLLDFPELK